MANGVMYVNLSNSDDTSRRERAYCVALDFANEKQGTSKSENEKPSEN